jgi:DNA-binding MarR family transcriptional regulator
LTVSPERCAREILDVTPTIIQALRVQMRAARQQDLSVPQFRTLAFLSRHRGSSLSAAAEFIGLTLPTMSVLVDGLVQRGIVDRAPDSQDRRRVLLSLTAEGERLHKQALDGSAAWLVAVLKPLDEQQRRTVVEAFEVLRPLFAAAAAPAGVSMAGQVEDLVGAGSPPGAGEAAG